MRVKCHTLARFFPERKREDDMAALPGRLDAPEACGKDGNVETCCLFGCLDEMARKSAVTLLQRFHALVTSG